MNVCKFSSSSNCIIIAYIYTISIFKYIRQKFSAVAKIKKLIFLINYLSTLCCIRKYVKTGDNNHYFHNIIS